MVVELQETIKSRRFAAPRAGAAMKLQTPRGSGRGGVQPKRSSSYRPEPTLYQNRRQAKVIPRCQRYSPGRHFLRIVLTVETPAFVSLSFLLPTTIRDATHRAHPHSLYLALATTVRGFARKWTGLQGKSPHPNFHLTQLIGRTGQVW